MYVYGYIYLQSPKELYEKVRMKVLRLKNKEKNEFLWDLKTRANIVQKVPLAPCVLRRFFGGVFIFSVKSSRQWTPLLFVIAYIVYIYVYNFIPVKL